MVWRLDGKIPHVENVADAAPWGRGCQLVVEPIARAYGEFVLVLDSAVTSFRGDDIWWATWWEDVELTQQFLGLQNAI